MKSGNADPVLLSLYRHRFEGIAEEMGTTLQRTSYSPNIKERLDFSCAIFDSEGLLVAQAAHIPVHLGAMPASVRAARKAVSAWSAGDLVILNDPYSGGTHLPDITMVSPVFFADRGSEPAFFVASRAHHADVGGMTPGSLPLSNEIYQEGLIIPPTRLYASGKVNTGLLDIILRNVRTPEERKGDLAAQQAAHATGSRRLIELADMYAADEVTAYARHLQDYSEQLVRNQLRQWPEGTYAFEDVMHIEIDNVLVPVMIKVEAQLSEQGVVFDFAGTSGIVPSSFNAVLSITESACYYVVRSLIGEDAPVNAGCFAPVQVKAEPGTLVHATPPAAVAGANVETSQRIVDTVFGAMAKALPGRVPAASQGTMNNLTIGGVHFDGTPYAYYETIGGGMGASAETNGLDGVQVHMTNTLNTPIEALERNYPFRIRQYRLRSNSGGKGRYKGGEGVVREYELLLPATVTMLSERRDSAPWGLNGGADGAPGRNILIDGYNKETLLPAKFSRRFQAGERLRIETPGGGGYGE